MTKEHVRKLLIAEIKSRALSFQDERDSSLRSEDVFSITSETRRIFGKFMEVHDQKIEPYYAGITIELFKFFSSNGHENFLVMVDVGKHFIVIPFNVVRLLMFEMTSTRRIGKDTKIRKHMDFHFMGPPYELRRGRVHSADSLVKNTDNFDILFNAFDYSEPKTSSIIATLSSGQQNNQDIVKRIIPQEIIAERSRAAEDMVMEYEKRQGRQVRSVSLRTVGYDIESMSRLDQSDVRFIEVKSRLGSFPLTLTANEMRVARQKGLRYFLYVVTDEKTIKIIKDPSKVQSEEKLVVHYELKEWEKDSKTINL